MRVHSVELGSGKIMNTADYLLASGADGAAAVITATERYTYGDLRAACERLVGELIAIGVQSNDRVGILGNNSLFWIAAYLAVLKLGAVAVPLPATAMPEEVGTMTASARCVATCAERRSYGRFATALAGCRNIIFDEVLRQPGPSAWPQVVDVDEDQSAALMFTSGTTAHPRAVRVTHRNIQANTDSIIRSLELTSVERIGVVLPFSYCFGTSLLHTHLRVGGSLVLAGSFVYPETVLDLLERTQCSGFAGVPSVYQTLLRNSTFGKRKLMSLRKVQQAGGKLQDVLIRELIGVLPDSHIYIMYGQTEATARLSCLPPALLGEKLGSIGRGIPGVTLRVIDEAGRDVAPGEVGEIWAWGDNICAGYVDDPEATREKFVNGALRTGDLATVDHDGFIYIVDRKSEFIKSYGYRVSSQQVEACILKLADVVAAAAIGEPDIARGEAIKVFITLRAGSTLTPEEIVAYCAKRMAHHMVPKEVVVVERLPMNAHGKVIKAELKGHVSQPTNEPVRQGGVTS